MYQRIIAWIMRLLRAIWIKQAVTEIPAPIGIPQETIETVNFIEGDETLALFKHILLYNTCDLLLSKDAFDKALYSTFDTSINNHSWYINILDILSKTVKAQLDQPDESFYLDDPLIKGLARGVPETKELGQFLTDGGVRTIHSAFSDLLAKTQDVYILYIQLKDHPTLSDIKKDYFSRLMAKPIEHLRIYLDVLFLHGNLNDKQEETNSAQQNFKRTR